MEGLEQNEVSPMEEEQTLPDYSAQESQTESVDHGRRNFLKGMIGTAALAAVGGQPLAELFREEVLPEDLERELSMHREKLKSEYGLDVDFDPITSADESSRELSLAERTDFTKDIYDGAQRYPKSYFNNIGLKAVQGVKWYDKKGDDPLFILGGFYRRSDPEKVVINKESPMGAVIRDKFGWGNDATVKYILHHEAYHKSDEHISRGDSFNENWRQESAKLGAPMTPDVRDVFNIRKPGFATSYGDLRPWEDRAEIAALLLTDPTRAEILAKEEPVLALKIKEVKEEYKRHSGGMMDETYWKLLAEGGIASVKEYFALREKLAEEKK